MESQHPSWAALLERAVSEPGIISSAYSQFHSYSLGNQLLAWSQCMQRGIPLGPLATFPRWKALGRYVRKGEKALAEGYTETTPFKHMGVTMVKTNRAAEGPRDRRLVGDEEQRLLKHAGSHLQALIIAALETGCRLGELLSLQWKYVDLTRRTITLISTRTKTSQTRSVPITSRLKAILEMRQHDPDGEPFGGDSFVFGTELGEQIGTIKTAWKATCRRAKIRGLVFHDLRREFGSRLIETPGVHPALVRDWLGHANITTTSRYLTTSAAGLTQAAKLFELNRFARFAH
jgi:integrase